MRLKLIGALALVSYSAFGGAQSNVNVTGFVKLGYENYKLTGGARAEQRLSDQSSRLTVAGMEGLGNGVQAFFQLESRFQLDMGADGSATGFIGGNSGFGLSGKFGQFMLGRWNLHFTEGQSLERGVAISDQMLATHGILSQVANVTYVRDGVLLANPQSASRIARASRSDNVFKYDSPKWGGLNLNFAYSYNPAGNEGSSLVGASGEAQGKGGACQLASRYENDSLNLGVSYWNYGQEGGGRLGDQKSWRVWAGYQWLPGLHVGLIGDHSAIRSDASTWSERAAWSLPVTYINGSHTAYFSYTHAGKVNHLAGTNARQIGLGYEHALSKRTVLGANFTLLGNGPAASYDFKSVTATGTLSGTATGAGQGARQLYAGISHAF